MNLIVKLLGTNRMFACRSALLVAASRKGGQNKLEYSDHQNYRPPIWQYKQEKMNEKKRNEEGHPIVM